MALDLTTPELEQTQVHQRPAQPGLIRVEQLTKRYKKTTDSAVDGISFEVSAGSFFALLGPNGAGKTTTISILTTTLLPTSGTVTIAGYDIERQPDRVRKELGIIFQKPSLDLNLTVEENIRFHAMLYGLYPFRPSFSLMPKSYREQVLELARIVDLEEWLPRKVKTLSGGMKRKLEIIRSLLHQPKVLFLDEPTAGLDAASRHNLWDYLQRVRREQGTTVFLTTHYLEEAEVADEVCIINKGKIVAQGSPTRLKNELTRSYVVVEAQDQQKLAAELTRLQIPFEGDSSFKLPVANNQTVHQLVRSITTPLVRLETFNPSLEEVYLEIVGKDYAA